MKIAFLNASARKNGNTNSLLSNIINGIDPKIFESELINISECKINYCLGCHGCEKTRKCVQNDDIIQIYSSFEKADLICIASPSYWGYVTGQLKVFFDRSTPYCNTIEGKTTFPNGKKGIAIALRAGLNESENMDIINSIEHYYSHLEILPIFRRTFEKIRNKSDLDTTVMTNKIMNFSNELNEWGRNCL